MIWSEGLYFLRLCFLHLSSFLGCRDHIYCSCSPGSAHACATVRAVKGLAKCPEVTQARLAGTRGAGVLGWHQGCRGARVAPGVLGWSGTCTLQVVSLMPGSLQPPGSRSPGRCWVLVGGGSSGWRLHLGENSFHPAATDLVFPRIHLSDTVVVPAFTGFAGVGDW